LVERDHRAVILDAVKILHTADWQIGMRAVAAGERAAEVREARLRAAERVVEEANRRGVELLLLAGDTFEDNAVEPVLIRRVVDLLLRAQCPVAVLPGNHDPLGPGSVFRHPAWREAEPRVRVLATTEPLELAGALLLPAPCESKSSTEDPTLRIARAPADRVRIGVAHGSLRDQGFEVAADDFPIGADAAERAGVDYLALGHWHSTLVLPSLKAARVAYPGTHEPTKFGERASGHALEVTLDGPGRPARVEVIATGTLEWIDRAETLTDDADVARVQAALDVSVAAPERALVRLKLQGLLSRAGFDAIDRLEETLRARFLSVRVEREGLQPRPADAAAWAEALPDGVARRVAERLLDEAQAQDAARAQIALEALARLHAMARKAQP
jgi:DNA repair exonuclease SbcCD nuclease subunit